MEVANDHFNLYVVYDNKLAYMPVLMRCEYVELNVNYVVALLPLAKSIASQALAFLYKNDLKLQLRVCAYFTVLVVHSMGSIWHATT